MREPGNWYASCKGFPVIVVIRDRFMSDRGALSKKLRNAVDGVLCQSLVKRPHALPSGRYVSLCFDDFPQSAAVNGAPLIEARDWRATWYVSGGLCGTEHERFGEMFTQADLRRLIRNGHDIGCHTFNHIDCSDASRAEIIGERERNAAFLSSFGVLDVQSFAYPYGAANLDCKRAMDSEAMALRGGKPGLNRGVADFNMLKATGLQTDRGGILRALEDLESLSNSDGWLILYTHDVQDDASDGGITPDDLDQVLQAIEASGADVVTVSDMVQRLTGGEHPTLQWAA